MNTEVVGSPPGAAQVPAAAARSSGADAASKSPEAKRGAKGGPAQNLATAAPQNGNGAGGGGITLPTPGHGLGQRVDIKV